VLQSLTPTIVFVLCFAYAAIRYTVFGGVDVEQIPLYVMNKSVSLAGLILLGWSSCHGDPTRRRDLGLGGLWLIVLHVLLSVLMLNPTCFDKFYGESDYMTWQAEASMLAGAIALMALGGLYLASRRPQSSVAETRGGSLVPGLGRIMLILAAAHVALMGYAGWFTPERWPGYLPPITLLSFLVAFVSALWRRK